MGDQVLIIVTGDFCGHCKKFISDQYKDLINKLSSNKKLTIIHSDYVSLNVEKPSYNHSQITINERGSIVKKKVSYVNNNFIGLIRWFPQFFLISGNIWTSDWSKLPKLDIKVLNGSITYDSSNNTFSTEASRDSASLIPLTADAISNWVIRNNTSLSSKGSVPIPQESVPAQIPSNLFQKRGHGYIKPSTNSSMYEFRSTSNTKY